MGGKFPRPRRPLPEGRNTQGRPVWEPPILNYEDLVDQDDYDKRRKALLTYYEGDVEKVTTYIDLYVEAAVTSRYFRWSQDNLMNAIRNEDPRQEEFLRNLAENIAFEEDEIGAERNRLPGLYQEADGSYVAKGAPDLSPEVMRQTFDRDLSLRNLEEESRCSGDKKASIASTESGGANLTVTSSEPTSSQAEMHATESTPLLSNSDRSDDEERATTFSASICRCLCS